MEEYSIKDLEKITGIKSHTIRIWEKRYKIFCPKRTSSNLRIYCNDDLKKLMSINTLLKYGYRISQIASFSDEEIKEKLTQLIQSKTNTNVIVENLIVALFDIDEEKFDKLYTRSILQYGFEETFIKIICPLFKKVELLWQIGKVNQIHKNFISNFIRRKIIIAIDAQIVSQQKDKTFLFFLPEGEFNDIKLLFFLYFVKKKSYKTIYLGENVSLKDLEEVFTGKTIDYLIFSFEKIKNVLVINDYLKKIENLFSNTKIIICCDTDEINSKSERVYFINTAETFIELINKL